MLGSIHDPEDGKSVAATVFGAVVVYVVSSPLPPLPPFPPRLFADKAPLRAFSCSAPARRGFTADSAPFSYTNRHGRFIFVFVSISFFLARLWLGNRMLGAGVIHAVNLGREDRGEYQSCTGSLVHVYLFGAV